LSLSIRYTAPINASTYHYLVSHLIQPPHIHEIYEKNQVYDFYYLNYIKETYEENLDDLTINSSRMF
jgi:hypothetical protein